MYDYSGQWAFTIGLPAKSGISGSLMVVIPNVMGLAIYSPRVDKRGNTVRGVEFCKKMSHEFNFSIFDQLVGGAKAKADPTVRATNYHSTPNVNKQQQPQQQQQQDATPNQQQQQQNMVVE